MVCLISWRLSSRRPSRLNWARAQIVFIETAVSRRVDAAWSKNRKPAPPEAEFVNADVRKEDDVRALIDKTVARFGRLDVAVNNAGTEGQVGPITEQTAESYAATFDTNVLGVILSMKHEVRAMQGQGRGSIINISSTYGHEGAAGAPPQAGTRGRCILAKATASRGKRRR